MSQDVSIPDTQCPTMGERNSFWSIPIGKPEVSNNLPEKLLRASEVAEILNISKAFAYQLMQQRKIRTVVIQAARRVRPEDLRLFIEENLS